MNDSSKSDSSLYGVPDRWFMLCLLAANYFTLATHRNLINFLQPPIKEDLQLNDQQLGWLHWAFYFSYAVSQIFVGYIGDRWRRRSILLASLLLSSATLAGMGLAQDFAQLMTLRVVLAVVQSASVPAIASVMADCFTPKTRSTAVSIYLFALPLSVVVSGSLGGLIGDVSQWRTAMFAFGGCSLVIWLTLLVFLREPARTERSAGVGLGEAGATVWQTLGSILGTPSFLLLALAYIPASTINLLTLYWLQRYFMELFDMRSLKAANDLATVWIQMGTVMGLCTAGWLADVWAKRTIVGRFSVQLIGLLLTIPALTVMGTSQDRIALYVAMLLYGIGINFYLANLWTTTFEVIDPAARATAIGLLNVAAGVFGLWVSPVIGHLKDIGRITSFGQIFTGSAVATSVSALLLAVIIMFTLPRDYRRSTS